MTNKTCKQCGNTPSYINELCASCTRNLGDKDKSILDCVSMIKIVADEIIDELISESNQILENRKEK